MLIPSATRTRADQGPQLEVLYVCMNVSPWRDIGGHILKWSSQRRNPVVLLTGITLTAMAWGLRTQTHTHTHIRDKDTELPLSPRVKFELAV